MNVKTRAIGYGRVSVTRKNVRSAAQQASNVAQYAVERSLELVSYIHDEDAGGRTMDRLGLQLVIQAVEADAVDVVVVEDVTRLCRDEEHLQLLKKLFDRHHVALHTSKRGGPVELAS